MVQNGTLADTIRTIYFYFFAALGLILLIVGVFQLSNWSVKSFLLPKYDLSYEENRCDYITPPAKPDVPQAEPVQSKAECLSKLEAQRKTRQLTDLTQALTFIIIGGLVFAFHIRKTSLLHKS